MRKHLLRMLVVMLLVCCGAFVFTACDDTPDETENQTYTLTYLANGGEGEDIVEVHNEGDAVTLKGADTFTREGYAFAKWVDGGTEYDAGASFTMPARNVALSAQWKQNGPAGGDETQKYTVSLSVSGGDDHSGNTAALDKQGEVDAGTKVTLTVTTAADYTAKVTLNGTEVNLTNGKYELTVNANAAFVVTFAKSGQTPATYNVSLNVNNGGDTGNTAALDKQGEVNAGTKVTLTVVTVTGYTVEVKVNGQTLQPISAGKYEYTVNANAAFVVTFTKSGGTGGETTPTITGFGGSNLLSEGEGFKILVRVKPSGFANNEAIQQTLKLAIGTESFDATFVEGNTEMTIVHFTVSKERAEALANGDLEVVLKCGTHSYTKPCTDVSEAENKKQIMNKTFLLNVKEEKLVLTVTTSSGPVKQEVTQFADVSIAAEEDGFAIAVRVQANGFADNDALKSGLKLIVGTLELSVKRIDDGNFKVVFFAVTKAQLAELAAENEVVLQCGENTYDKPYSVISGGQNQIALEGKTYALSGANDKLTLTVSEGTGGGSGGQESGGGGGTGGETAMVFGDTNIVAEVEAFAIYVRLSANGYTDETAFRNAVKLIIDSTTYDATEIQGWANDIKVVRFLFSKEQANALTNGDHAVAVKLGDTSYDKPYTVISGAQYTVTTGGKTYTLNEQSDKLYLTVSEGTGGGSGGGSGGQESGGGTGSETAMVFGDTNIVAEGGGFAIYVRLSANGYTDQNAFKNAVKLTIGSTTYDATEVTGWSDNVKVVKFLFTQEQVNALSNGDHAVAVKLGDTSYDKPYSVISSTQSAVECNGKTYTLNEKGGKLYLTCAV